MYCNVEQLQYMYQLYGIDQRLITLRNDVGRSIVPTRNEQSMARTRHCWSTGGVLFVRSSFCMTNQCTTTFKQTANKRKACQPNSDNKECMNMSALVKYCMLFPFLSSLASHTTRIQRFTKEGEQIVHQVLHATYSPHFLAKSLHK